jgi:outer membrane protein
MKKITILSALICCISLCANGQTEKGRYMVGGSVGFSSTKDKQEFTGVSTDGNKNTNIWVMPSFGLFVADGIVAGAGLAITSNKAESDDGTSSFTSSGLTIAPFARYYHESGLFGHLNFEIGSGKNKNESGGTTTETKDSIFGWKVGGGYALFINNNVVVEPMITYGSTSLKAKDSPSDFKLTNSGLLISVGFNIFIN